MNLQDNNDNLQIQSIAKSATTNHFILCSTQGI